MIVSNKPHHLTSESAGSKPRILYLTKYSRLQASSRYRVFNWAKLLRDMGFSTDVLNLITEKRKKQKFNFYRQILQFIWRYDVIVLHKIIPSWTLRIILNSCKYLFNTIIILEFDDRIYSDKDLLNHYSQFKKTLSQCSKIIVSVEEMQKEIGTHHPRLTNKIEVLPTLIDLLAYPQHQSRSENRPFTIGWIGSSSGLQYLEQIEPYLRSFLKDKEGKAELVVVCDLPFKPGFNDYPVRNVRWELDKELDYFFMLEASLMPLDNSPRARCKAGFKAIQSLAAGTPVIASAVGFNKEVIAHGKNGYLAEKPSDFERYLEELYSMQDRSAMSQACKESAARFDYKAWIERYLEIVLNSQS
ncbi:glycosyltransferase [Desulfocurvibacter africanus PCS]|uniref:Glycosyltransferase n=2 Tax=Desulfocurvibacter africanus TaxID=873 RepID=M5PP23_DESAF|nr:glycosyltransferase [Desulfocurvibacter africanus PCS]